MAPHEIDDDSPLDPAESLRLIESQRAAASRNLTPDPRVFLWPWGIAWLIGFTVFFLRFGPDGRVFVRFPEWLPLVLLAALIMLAGAFTGLLGARSSRQISGPSTRQSAMYGITWAVAFFSLSVVLGRVSGSVAMPGPEVSLMWAGAMVALTGVLHMAGGVVYRDSHFFYLGIYISVVNLIGVLLGPGWHSLMVAVLGGGGMLVAGAIARVRWSR